MADILQTITEWAHACVEEEFTGEDFKQVDGKWFKRITFFGKDGKLKHRWFETVKPSVSLEEMEFYFGDDPEPTEREPLPVCLSMFA